MVLGKRYLYCPAAVTIGHLQKFIRLKYGLGQRYKVDILCHSELLLPEYHLLDVAYATSWTQEEPLRLFYRIYQIKCHYEIPEPSPPVVECQEDKAVETSEEESAKISEETPIRLFSTDANWGETRGAKQHAPETCNTADLKRDVNSVSKKKRLNETSQSERLKLVAKVKSEKLNGHCELKTKRNPQLFNSCNSFKLIMSPSEKDGQKESNHNNLNLASAVKPGLKFEKRNGELDKIENDLKPSRSDHLFLPPLAKIDTKASGKFRVESKNNSLRRKIKKNCGPDHTDSRGLFDPKRTVSNTIETAKKQIGSTETENSCEKEVDKRTPELNVRDRCISTQFLDINSENTRKKSDILSDTLLDEIKDRALSKGSSVKDLSISATEDTIAYELPSLVCERSSIELVSTVQKNVSPTPCQKGIDSDDFTGSRNSIYESEPSSKKRKVSNGGPTRTMPNLIAISEMPTPLVARSVQTLAGSRKPDVRIVEAVRNNEPEKLSLKDGVNSPQSSAVILDLSEKTSSAKSLSCNVPEKKTSRSTTFMPNLPKIPAVKIQIKERGITPKSTCMNPVNKESYQHEQASLLPRGNAPVQSFNTMSNPHPNSVQNHMLQSMALAQTQHMQQLQAAMYAASAAKQASGATSPLVNPVEFERVRNILTWNALAHIQGHRPPTTSLKESPRFSSRLSCDRSEDFVTSQTSNVIKPKIKYNQSSSDSVRGNMHQFIELQQNARFTSTSNPRLSLNSSVREIPNPSLLQQRRLTQLLNVNIPENTIAGRTSDIPSPKRVMENKLAANKELTVSIVSSGDKSRKS